MAKPPLPSAPCRVPCHRIVFRLKSKYFTPLDLILDVPVLFYPFLFIFFFYFLLPTSCGRVPVQTSLPSLAGLSCAVPAWTSGSFSLHASFLSKAITSVAFVENHVQPLQPSVRLFSGFFLFVRAIWSTQRTVLL